MGPDQNPQDFTSQQGGTNVHPIWAAILQNLGRGLASLTPERQKMWQTMENNQQEAERQKQAQDAETARQLFTSQNLSAYQKASLAQQQTQDEQLNQYRQGELDNQQTAQTRQDEVARQKSAMEMLGLQGQGYSQVPSTQFSIPGVNLGGISSPSIPGGTPTSPVGNAQFIPGVGGPGKFLQPPPTPMYTPVKGSVAEAMFGAKPIPINDNTRGIVQHDLETLDKNKLKESEQAQLVPLKLSSHQLVDTALGKSQDPIDSVQAKLYHSMIDDAQTPAQMESLKKELGSYMANDSHTARLQHLQNAISQSVGIENAKREDEEKRILSKSDMLYKNMIDSGQPPSETFRGMRPEARMVLINDWEKRGLKFPEWLTGQAQKVMQEIGSTHDTATNALKTLNSFKVKENGKEIPLSQSQTPFSLLPDRLKYALGMGNPGDKSSLINQLEVFKGLASGRIAHGAGVNTQAFVDYIKAHTPDVKTDSPYLISKKIGDIQNYLKIQEQNTRKYGNKWGAIKMSEGGMEEDKPQQSIEDLLKAAGIGGVGGGR